MSLPRAPEQPDIVRLDWAEIEELFRVVFSWGHLKDSAQHRETLEACGFTGVFREFDQLKELAEFQAAYPYWRITPTPSKPNRASWLPLFHGCGNGPAAFPKLCWKRETADGVLWFVIEESGGDCMKYRVSLFGSDSSLQSELLERGAEPAELFCKRKAVTNVVGPVDVGTVSHQDGFLVWADHKHHSGMGNWRGNSVQVRVGLDPMAQDHPAPDRLTPIAISVSSVDNYAR